MSALKDSLIVDAAAIVTTALAFSAACNTLTTDLQTAAVTQEVADALSPRRVLGELVAHLIGQHAMPLDAAMMRSAMATVDRSNTFPARIAARITALVP